MLLRSILVALLSAITMMSTQLGADDKQNKAFWQAARDGDTTKIQALLDAGVSPNAKTEFDCTAVYFAANNNRAGVIELLIEAGADITIKDTDYGFTAMQMAGWLGHTEAVEALIDGGASENDTTGAMFAAAGNGHADTVKLIIDRNKYSVGLLTSVWNTAKSNGADNVMKVLEKAGVIPLAAKKADTSNGLESDEEKTEALEDTKPKFDFSADRAIPVTKPANWPEFRGADRSGIADGQHPPLAFDLATGRNVRWTKAVEGLGLSSPIIWDGRIYITTAVSEATKQSVDDNGLGWIAAVPEAVEHQWLVNCYDLKSGELIWSQPAASGIPKSARHWKASQANSTCATDGTHLIALFGSEGLHCFDMDGQLQWSKDLGVLNPGWYIDSTFEWGYASSPVIYEDSVIVQCDFPGDSFVAAYRLSDGSEKWKTSRTELPSWGTPTVVRGSQRDEVVLNGSKAVCSYDAATGELLWQVRGNSPITVASPITQGSLIMACGGYKNPKPIYVVRAGASGDLTPAEEATSDDMVWTKPNSGEYIVTPLMYQGLLYIGQQNGVMTCYDQYTGEVKYKTRLSSRAFTASPVAADGKLYYTAEDGAVIVLQAGSEFQEIARSELGAASLATPAISDGVIVFRTVKGLAAVGHQAVDAK